VRSSAGEFPFAARLTDAEHVKLLRLVQVFLKEKIIEGCDGLEVTEEMKVMNRRARRVCAAAPSGCGGLSGAPHGGWCIQGRTGRGVLPGSSTIWAQPSPSWVNRGGMVW